jgi:serine/threonine protein kinase
VKDLMQKIFVKDPEKRITVKEIKRHSFFDMVDFEKILFNQPPIQKIKIGTVEKLTGWAYYKKRTLTIYNNSEFFIHDGRTLKHKIHL